jgi:hypothetical protein
VSATVTRSSRRRTLRAALGSTITASAAPYGYTLTIWSSGAILIRARGSPTVGDVFMFIAGALIGFDVLGAVARGALNREESPHRRQDRVLAATLDWIAVGAAAGAVALLAEIPSWVPWLIAPLLATIVYMLAAALQLSLVALGGRASDP